MNYLFFGTPRFAAIVLEKLLEANIPPTAVICNPDRPVGRKQVITAPPVKLIASSNKIPVWQPDPITNYQLPITNFDFAVIAAYAKIIPGEILKIPRLGTIGVHPSLLPKYRGASPIQSAILSGEAETGVTLYLVDEKMDHGSILATNHLGIATSDTYETLEEKLAALGGELLVKTIPDFIAGKIIPQPQDHTKATFTKKFKTEDGLVDLRKDAPEIIWRKIRALNPEPGIWTLTYPGHEGKRVKLLEAYFIPSHSRESGNLGIVKFKKIQLEGKKPQVIEK